MDGWTDKRTDKGKSPCVLQDVFPFEAAAQKQDLYYILGGFTVRFLLKLPELGKVFDCPSNA